MLVSLGKHSPDTPVGLVKIYTYSTNIWQLKKIAIMIYGYLMYLKIKVYKNIPGGKLRGVKNQKNYLSVWWFVPIFRVKLAFGKF